MLAGGHVVAARGVHDHDAFFACLIDIDVFETDASPSNDFEIFSGFDQVPRDFGAASNDPAIVVSDNLFEFIGFEPDTNVYFEARSALEDFQSLGSQRVCDENSHRVNSKPPSARPGPQRRRGRKGSRRRTFLVPFRARQWP